MAARLGMSPRSLQRGIAASGTSFSVLRDDIRFELASSLLTRSSLSISEIAYRLGYAEIASFTHAFTKRFGQSPRKFRSSAGDFQGAKNMRPELMHAGTPE